jgi:hypothetical protein
MGYTISGVCTGDATFGCLTTAELICMKLKCVLEILFLSGAGLGLPGTRKMESVHGTATS